MWAAIFEQNRDELLNALDLFEVQLGDFRKAIESRDEVTLRKLLAEAKKNRDAFD